jgi:hypothetical protein
MNYWHAWWICWTEQQHINTVNHFIPFCSLVRHTYNIHSTSNTNTVSCQFLLSLNIKHFR